MLTRNLSLGLTACKLGCIGAGVTVRARAGPVGKNTRSLAVRSGLRYNTIARENVVSLAVRSAITKILKKLQLHWVVLRIATHGYSLDNYSFPG